MPASFTNVQETIADLVAEVFPEVFSQSISPEIITVNTTPKEFKGDFTIVTFPLVRYSKVSPEITADKLGKAIVAFSENIESYNVVKGFLNLLFNDKFWLDFLEVVSKDSSYGFKKNSGSTIVVEYCGPNTNKPLHLGHIRNMLIGSSVCNILEANGHNVKRVNIYNDRGIAICKSMVAWKRSANGATPESTNTKGDHFVGNFYVEYNTIFQKELLELIDKGIEKEKAEKEASIYKEAVELLQKWEAGDAETMKLWKQMNSWVYEGFEQTYKDLGVWFEKAYYESDTYLDGKKIIEEGLQKKVYFKKDDGSVWVDLTEEGLDQKVLIRSDGTAVYLTQDLGTAQHRYDDYKMDRSVYVVANEQDYHFKVLKLTLQKLGKIYADGIYHLSYGMVDLPSGKMKSREGTTVNADDLVIEMIETAAEHTRELGKIDDLSEAEAIELFRKLGLGAIKYFILKVNPKKRILFDPKESVDFQGNTGPFIQYTYARIQSILRKEMPKNELIFDDVVLEEAEKELMKLIERFPASLVLSGQNMDPSEIANYVFALSKQYNKFYAEVSVLKADSEEQKQIRLLLSKLTSTIIEKSMKLLGIEVPEQM